MFFLRQNIVAFSCGTPKFDVESLKHCNIDVCGVTCQNQAFVAEMRCRV